MSLDGSMTFGDLVGKLGTLRVTCAKRDREGHYSVGRLIERHGADHRITDWVAGITDDCPKRRGTDMSDQCGARCPDLAVVT